MWAHVAMLIGKMMIHPWGCEANLVAVHFLQDIADLKSFPFEAYDVEVPDPAAEDLVIC